MTSMAKPFAKAFWEVVGGLSFWNCFSNLAFHSDATEVAAELLNFRAPLRSFDTILVVGGSPCQGESMLNQRREGPQDPG